VARSGHPSRPPQPSSSTSNDEAAQPQLRTAALRLQLPSGQLAEQRSPRSPQPNARGAAHRLAPTFRHDANGTVRPGPGGVNQKPQPTDTYSPPNPDDGRMYRPCKLKGLGHVGDLERARTGQLGPAGSRREDLHRALPGGAGRPSEGCHQSALTRPLLPPPVRCIAFAAATQKGQPHNGPASRRASR